MNMVNRPRFRRKLRARPESPEDDLRPVPPLERPADRRAREERRAAEEQRRAALRGPAPEPSGADDRWQEAAASDAVTRTWDAMRSFTLEPQHAEENRIVTAGREDPAHEAFDLLCARVLSAVREQNWTRIAVTSPTKGCGKTFTSANLGIALARQESLRTIVLDFDLHSPSLHRMFGIDAPGALGTMLRGQTSPEVHLRRLASGTCEAGPPVAFGFNDTAEPHASHLLRDPRSARALDRLEERLEPEVVLIDLPPMLSSDDVLALRPQFDAVLLVTGGGVTTDAQIREVETRLGASTPLLGVVLNRAELDP